MGMEEEEKNKCKLETFRTLSQDLHVISYALFYCPREVKQLSLGLGRGLLQTYMAKRKILKNGEL